MFSTMGTTVFASQNFSWNKWISDQKTIIKKGLELINKIFDNGKIYDLEVKTETFESVAKSCMTTLRKNNFYYSIYI